MLLQSLVACTWISSWLQLDGLCSVSWFVWAWRTCSYCWCWSSLLIDREIGNTQRMDGTPLLPIGALWSHILSEALQVQSLTLQGCPELLSLAFQVLVERIAYSSGISCFFFFFLPLIHCIIVRNLSSYCPNLETKLKSLQQLQLLLYMSAATNLTSSPESFIHPWSGSRLHWSLSLRSIVQLLYIMFESKFLWEQFFFPSSFFFLKMMMIMILLVNKFLMVVMMDTGYIMCMTGSRDQITLLWIWRRSQVVPWF